MNKRYIIIAVSLALAMACLLSGCSKSNNASSAGGSGSGRDSASSPPAGPVTLKVKWIPGKEYAMRMEETETIEFNLPDEPKPVKQVRKMTMDYTVSVLKELADGGRELECSFTVIKTSSSEGKRQTLDFDSTRDTAPDADNPVASMFHRLIGERVRLVLDAEGRVVRVDGYDAFVDRVAGSRQAQMKAMFRQMFSEDNLKQIGSVADGLPDHPVKAGDHWPVNLELPNPIGIIVIHLKDTFKGWESRAGRQCVRIAFEGDIASKPGPNSANTSARLEKGVISGQTWFDPALGMMVQSDDAEDMPLQIKNRGRVISGQIHRTASRTLLDVTDIGK